jgi:hypothetical protein
LAVFVFLSVSNPCRADAPHQVGPFILGHDVSEFADYLDMTTEMPIRYLETVHEVEMKPIKGFKSGLVAFSTCSSPGRVIRIKLKYDDSSKSFFEDLRKRIIARYGAFDEYRGDPFRIVIAWKKSFIDDQNNRISLIIQHNTRDEEEKMGNSIKMTMTDLLEKDVKCLEKKETGKSEPPIEISTGNLWNLFLPR